MSSPLILVTGANGFLGSALCGTLARLSPVRGAVRRTSKYMGPAAVDLVIGDLSSTFDWSDALAGVSVVVHCAARVHVMREVAGDPLAEYRSVNVVGTLNLARQAARAGVRRFVFLSSIKVNGEATQPGNPFLADQSPAPGDPYGIAKREAEEGLRSLARETGMEVVVIRPPLIYGPNAPGNFATLTRFLVKGIPLPLASVVTNRRSFVFIDNLVDLIVICLDHPAAANHTFLVSDAESLSTAALLRRMGDALGRPARLIPVPVPLLRMGAALLGMRDMAQRLCGSLEVDISKTRELLGWMPPISVDEGLRRTAEPFMRGQG